MVHKVVTVLGYHREAMYRLSLHFVKSRQLAWLLGLLLLLPLAQVAAQWHLTSHLHTESSRDNHVLTQEHCDLCLTALQASGGAPLVQVQPPPLQRFGFDTPIFRPSPVHTAAVWLPYRSRAPPQL